MNCDSMDSILDEHRSARLHAAERQGAAAHLAGCAKCADNWAAHDALAGEQVAEPPPELFARVLGRVGAGARSEVVRRHGWLIGAAAAAAAAVVGLIAVGAYVALDLGSFADHGVRLRISKPSSSLLEHVSDFFASRSPLGADAPPGFVAGRDYEVLADATPLAATAEGVPVVEFFMYWCLPCNAFEPELERYRTASPGRVALTRVPAVFNPLAELHARAFYTAEVLGKLDAMHAAFYDEIHGRNNRLESRAALAEFFARFGVDTAAFDAAFDSSDVAARVQRAAVLAREYDVRVTPLIVVAGRYATSPAMAGSSLLAVVDELVDREAPCAVRCESLRQRAPVRLEQLGEQ